MSDLYSNIDHDDLGGDNDVMGIEMFPEQFDPSHDNGGNDLDDRYEHAMSGV